MRASVRVTAICAGAAAVAAAAAMSILHTRPSYLLSMASVPLALLPGGALGTRRATSARTVARPDTRAAALLARLARADSRDPVVYYEIARHVAQAADTRDRYMSGHSERTAEYAVVLGQELGLAAHELDRIRLAALLHDIGKLDVRPYLLTKPGRLTAAERDEIRQHARRGAEMLHGNAAMTDLLPGIELHHECWDGSGYPYGLRGEAIPLMARVIAVADTFDALTSERVYQSAISPAKAAALIKAFNGTRFCPRVSAAFLSVFDRGAMTQIAHSA